MSRRSKKQLLPGGCQAFPNLPVSQPAERCDWWWWERWLSFCVGRTGTKEESLCWGRIFLIFLPCIQPTMPPQNSSAMQGLIRHSTRDTSLPLSQGVLRTLGRWLNCWRSADTHLHYLRCLCDQAIPPSEEWEPKDQQPSPGLDFRRTL